MICAITSQAQYKIENILLFGEMNEFIGTILLLREGMFGCCVQMCRNDFWKIANILCTRITLDELRCILDIQVESASFRVCAFRKLKTVIYVNYVVSRDMPNRCGCRDS